MQILYNIYPQCPFGKKYIYRHFLRNLIIFWQGKIFRRSPLHFLNNISKYDKLALIESSEL